MNSNITLVTGLYDMGRGNLASSFKRDFQFYLDRFKELLETTSDYPMVVFTEPKVVPLIQSIKGAKNPKMVQIVERSSSEFLDWFEFSKKIKQLRENPSWYSQVPWLEESPQAKLDMYLPFVLGKMFMLSDSSIMDPFSTEYFLWIDAGITNTVHKGYFSHDKILNRLEPYLDPFLFLTFPYSTGPEIHGFQRNAMNNLCETPNVEFVCRGGFFGGKKESIQQFNGLYYSLLSSTLNAGLLGTEESLFTILAYRNPTSINMFMLQEYGMISNFCESVKTGKGSFVDTNRIKHQSLIESHSDIKQLAPPDLKKSDPLDFLIIYCLTFNFPDQLKHTLQTIKTSYPDIFDKPTWVLVDNSTSNEARVQNKQLAKELHFRYESHGNLGICGARQWVAEDFSSHPEFQTMLFFEDDMTLCDKFTPPCRSGFVRYVPNLIRKSISILYKENLDFLKLSFSEFFGSNEKAWAWCNVPNELLPDLFPERPERIDNDLMPATHFSAIKTFDGLAYALGLVHYCNWPILLTQEGSKKIYLDPIFRFPHESTIMSHTYQRQVKGEITGGVLLASPVEHHRFQHYPAEERIECL